MGFGGTKDQTLNPTFLIQLDYLGINDLMSSKPVSSPTRSGNAEKILKNKACDVHGTQQAIFDYYK